MDDYLVANKNAYDATAEEFQQKKDLRHAGTVKLVDSFLAALSQYSPQKLYSILELGPGSGYASMLISEDGNTVTAIEFSEPMAVLAQQTADKAKVIVGEFLAYDFGEEKYDGILAVAFIHLFPLDDASKVIRKIFNLLNERAIALIVTTKHGEMSEGYAVKTNFKSTRKRYRREYDKASLEELLISCGFTICSYHEDDDDEVSNKVWMNFIVQK